MSNERDKGVPGGTESQQPASAGQRVDQFLAGAQRLGGVVRDKARETAQVAAPKLKDLGQSASATASRLVDERVRRESPIDRIWQILGGGHDQRKLMVRGGLVVGGLLAIVLVLTSAVLHLAGGSGPNRSNFDKVRAGMSESQVDRLLGMATASAKGIDGSTAKTWLPENKGDPAILVVFIDGKATTKAMEGSTNSTPEGTVSMSPPVSMPLAASTDYAAMDVATLGSIIQEKLMPGQGLMPEGMWKSSVYPQLCRRQYSLVGRALKNLQMANRVDGECRTAILALQQKVGIPVDAPPANEVARPPDDKPKVSGGPKMPEMPKLGS